MQGILGFSPFEVVREAASGCGTTSPGEANSEEAVFLVLVFFYVNMLVQTRGTFRSERGRDTIFKETQQMAPMYQASIGHFLRAFCGLQVL